MHSNRLINESSPYLLQHANNPVDWYPWCDEAFAKAKEDKKMVLISIGYSACHWCHVMERESFEDAEVASIMNDYFVCIKVDREERPDVDQLYMDAVQLISGRGGWPLNCFALPDGRPIYGGTYFPKANWKQLLLNLNNLYRKEPEKVLEFAAELENGIIKISHIPDVELTTERPDFKQLDEFTAKLASSFDSVLGGYNYSPKFPMPNNYEFMLYQAYVLKQMKRTDESGKLAGHVYLTLDKMAMGGIYDQVEGGFARYSTDSIWKVSHFEKMLYDNGQLMTLYAHAYMNNPKKLYKEVVYGIYDFVCNQLLSPEGGFYCALDADSEGIEGLYYIWRLEEIKAFIPNDLALFSAYYSIVESDVWEHGCYILNRKKSDEEFCTEHGITEQILDEKKKGWVKILTGRRTTRVKPGLDDKILASWNGLMLKGLTDAYKTLKEPIFLATALKNADFIVKKFITEDGSMFHNYKNGKATVTGFLEDYAFTAHAFISLYQCTFDEKWLALAEQLTEYAIAHFYDKEKYLFYYTSDTQQAIIARKAETNDNVIPASNSAMGHVLFELGHTLGKDNYLEMANNMLCVIKENMNSYPQGYTNWAMLMLNHYCKFYEVAMAGRQSPMFRDKLNTVYLPNKVLVGAETQSGLELLKEKLVGERTLIYVCENKTCKMPVSSVQETITQVEGCI